jgi:hypothetical protein
MKDGTALNAIDAKMKACSRILRFASCLLMGASFSSGGVRALGAEEQADAPAQCHRPARGRLGMNGRRVFR